MDGPGARSTARKAKLDDAVAQQAEAGDLDFHGIAGTRKHVSDSFLPMATPAGLPVVMMSPGSKRRFL